MLDPQLGRVDRPNATARRDFAMMSSYPTRAELGARRETPKSTTRREDEKEKVEHNTRRVVAPDWGHPPRAWGGGWHLTRATRRLAEYPHNMEFVLHYRGSLRANAGPVEKQAIRRVFHAQLRELWQQRPLKNAARILLATEPKPGDFTSFRPLSPFTFIPLVTADLRMLANLEIMLLRPEEPGSLITQGGDIDNRLKTLFDALRMPKHLGELPKDDAPQETENPFYCLLEDDNLLKSIRVQTERLLDSEAHTNEVLLLIQVNIQIIEMIWGNMFFT